MVRLQMISLKHKEEDTMKMEYMNPELEVVKFSAEDVLEASESYTPNQPFETGATEI